MSFSISKLSLRTRLLLMTAFALLALTIAVLSAYRTAQTSAYYAERQAAASVGAVARSFARGADDAIFFERNRKMPPHVREAFEKYTDEETRRTAVALGVERETSAGLCAADGARRGTVVNQNFSAEETVYIENVCRNVRAGELRRVELKNSTLFIETIEFDDETNGVTGAFAARSVEKSGIFADRFNFITQAFLLAAAVGLLIFSFLTLREWRAGMRRIEDGLQKMPDDLTQRIHAPKIAELALFAGEINRLAENLETNLARRRELEKTLTQSEKLAALGRVAAGVAHEIRNPLAAIKLKIQLAERSIAGGQIDRAKLEKTFAVLDEEIRRLDRLVSKMLDAGKTAKLNFAPLAPNELLRARIAFFGERAAAQNVRVVTEFSGEAAEIRADAEKLTQIFDNLLLNALEAMPAGGTLRVASANEAEKVVFQFSDSGAGISAAEKDRIFEPFYTTKDAGNGLGLAIAREIVEAHGGKLFAAEAETGARFVLELPRAFTA